MNNWIVSPFNTSADHCVLVGSFYLICPYQQQPLQFWCRHLLTLNQISFIFGRRRRAEIRILHSSKKCPKNLFYIKLNGFFISTHEYWFFGFTNPRLRNDYITQNPLQILPLLFHIRGKFKSGHRLKKQDTFEALIIIFS